MKISLFTIWDKVAEEAGPIFQAKNEAVAQRQFRFAIREARPDEYRLYCVGEFDTEKVMVYGLSGRPKEIHVPDMVPEKVKAE